MSRRRIYQDLDAATARKASLEKRQAVLWSGMEPEKATPTLMRSDRWFKLAELYDKCGDQLGVVDSEISGLEADDEEPAQRFNGGAPLYPVL